MNKWVWSVSATEWKEIESENILTMSNPNHGKSISIGDFIVFYVKEIQQFRGIFEVAMKLFDPNIPLQYNGPSVSKLSFDEGKLGFASLKTLLPDLEFIEKKESPDIYLQQSMDGPANFGKPISDKDYELILLMLKQQRTSQPDTEESPDLVSLPESASLDSLDRKFYRLPSPTDVPISSIISEINTGQYSIPIFQRQFVWTRKQVEELWESIIKSHFIGSIFTWNTNEVLEKYPILGAHGVNENAGIILDGQQRLTSIYLAVMGHDISFFDNEKYKFFINLKWLLDPSADETDIVISYNVDIDKNKTYLDKKTQFKKKLFPLYELQNRNYLLWISDFKNYLEEYENYTKEDSKKYFDSILGILDNIWLNYKIPVVKLSSTISLSDIVSIFEKINSRGTKLNLFDLINARLVRYGIYLKKLWEKAQSNYSNIDEMSKELDNDSQKFILYTMYLLKNGHLRTNDLLKSNSIYISDNQLDKNKFMDDWDQACKYIDIALEKLGSQRQNGFGVIDYSFIPYTIIIPILAALLCKAEERSDGDVDSDAVGKRIKKIEYWYWAVISSDRYSGSTNTNVEIDFKEMQEWFKNDDNIPTIVKTQREQFDKINFDTAQQHKSIYKAVLCLISKYDTLDFIKDKFIEHHIKRIYHLFPISTESEDEIKNKLNSVLNKTFLDKETYNIFKNKRPSVYLKELVEEREISEKTLRTRLRTHLASDTAFDHLLKDNFDGFLIARNNTIKEKYMKLLFPPEDHDSWIDEQLKRDESQTLEFKATLHREVDTGNRNSKLEYTVIKTLSGFMNSFEPGILLIGVGDNKDIIGIEKDFPKIKENELIDTFQRHLTMIINRLGNHRLPLVKIKFHKKDGKTICMCKVKLADKPVFMKHNEKGYKFYIRTQNSTQSPPDQKEYDKYCIERYGHTYHDNSYPLIYN